MSNFRQRVLKALTNHFADQAVLCSHDANIIDEWRLDSLDVFEAVMILEEEFGIEIEDDEISADAATINQLTELVRKKVDALRHPKVVKSIGGVIFDIEAVDRFEVIDHRSATGKPGRIIVANGMSISISLQDDERTMKVFLAD